MNKYCKNLKIIVLFIIFVTASCSSNQSEKIEELINKSSKIYKNLASYRDKIFSNAIDQIVSILYNVHRIKRLNSDKYNIDNYEASFKKALVKVLDKENFAIIKDNEISIPRSEPYGLKSISYSYYSSEVKCYHKSFRQKLDIKCPEHYSRPIPSNKQARKMEINNLSKEVAISLNILNSFNDKLSLFEIKLAEIQNIESTLSKLKNDFDIGLVDLPKAIEQTNVYNKLLIDMTKSIEKINKNILLEYTPSEESVNEILTLICEKIYYK